MNDQPPSPHDPITCDWEPLSAAALAGGKSRRMGRDKAFLPIVAGGPPMLSIVRDHLRTVATDVKIVAGDRERYARFEVPVVPDLYLEGGALGGIHAAINQATYDHCLVVACDMPFLNRALLERMAREPRTYDVLIPRLPGESRQGGGLVFQTLHAIYSKTCLPAIEARLAQGNRQVIGFFGDVRVRTIDLPEVLAFDPKLHAFFNANTPEALAAAAEIGRSRGEPSQCDSRVRG